MAKWSGKVGYIVPTEIEPGEWIDKPVEYPYLGDVLQTTVKVQSTDQVNSDVKIINRLSIVSDPFAMGHVHTIRYAEYMGVMWSVTDIAVQTPRLILTLGGVYNGEQV